MTTKYARIEVKTDSGCRYRYVQYQEDWKLGKHLLRYYSKKQYQWEEISKENLGVIKAMMGKSKFNNIKWVII